MKLLGTTDICDWIDGGIAQAAQWTVSRCIPPIFPSYLKIFHSIYEDLGVRDDGLTWQQHEKAGGAALEPMTETERILAQAIAESTLVYGRSEEGSCLSRVWWADLAQRFDIAFLPTLSAASFTRVFPGGSWPRRLIGPDEGYFLGPQRDALISVLSGHTAANRILFHVGVLATTDWGEEKVFEGSLDEAGLFPDEGLGVRGTPTYWFPEDRSWLVCTDWDLTFSLIGGSLALAAELLAHPVIECVPVLPETRVDWNADLDSPPC